MKARIAKWLISNEPAITFAVIFLGALALMGQFDGVLP